MAGAAAGPARATRSVRRLSRLFSAPTSRPRIGEIAAQGTSGAIVRDCEVVWPEHSTISQRLRVWPVLRKRGG
jgi:hypothetical protein